MSACVICDRPCVPPRRVYYTPPSKRTIRQHVERELFVARETYARQPAGAKSGDLATYIVHLGSWLEMLDRVGGGSSLAFPQRPHRTSSEGNQLALPEVA